MDLLYLLEHACSELHRLMVLLLQHIHVEVVQVVVSVIIHPAFIQLKQQGQEKSYQMSFKAYEQLVWYVCGLVL